MFTQSHDAMLGFKHSFWLRSVCISLGIEHFDTYKVNRIKIDLFSKGGGDYYIFVWKVGKARADNKINNTQNA